MESNIFSIEDIQKIYAEAINIFNNAFTETVGKKKRAPNKKKGGIL